MKKYATGIRCVKGFDITRVQEVRRVDLLLCWVMKEGVKEFKTKPEAQFHFSFHPDSVTPDQIARCLRSLAYKIQKLQEKVL